MDKMLIKIFQDEIRKQSFFALTSIEHVNNFLKNNNHLPSDYFWYYIQNFLNSSANVSKLLWGSNKEQNLSRKDLRESLKIKEDSVLFSKTLRNDFEHYDERIETWYKDSKNHVYVDSNIGYTGAIMGIDTSLFLRNYDTTKAAVTFKGKIYELQPIVTEMTNLNKTLERIINSR